MKKLSRYIIRIAGGIIALLLIAWISLWVYLSLNKKDLEKKIKTELQKKINAKVSFRNLDVSLFHTFPFISLQLDNVIVRDSLWETHKHDLLNVAKIYGQINPFKILIGKSPFSKLVVENGKLYLFTDSSGYSNVNIFRKQDQSKNTTSEDYPDIAGKNIQFVVEKEKGKKLFDFEIEQVNSAIIKANDVLFFNGNINVFVHNMIFNPGNGSFLQEKKISGSCKVQYNLMNKILSFHDLDLDIDQQPFLLSGKFFTAINPAPFAISLQTKNVSYKQAAALLSFNIRKKLDQYNISKPMDLYATLDGTNPLTHDPVIHLWMQTNNAIVETPFEIFTNCSFNGNFNNKVDLTKLPGDRNSVLRFNQFSGVTENVQLNCDSIIFNDLIHPQLTCNLRSELALQSLNNLFDSRDIEFEKGNAKLDVVYKGPVEDGDSIQADINGYINFDSAAIRYLPKNFLLDACSGKLVFINKDVLIDALTARVGSTQLKMNGGIKSLVTLIDKSPDKLILYWNIFSPKLNLHDFRSFMGKNMVSSAHKKSKRLFTKQVSQLDHVLSSCDVRLQIKANELSYKRFSASNINAGVILKDDIIKLDSVSLNNSGGALEFAGFVKEDGINNAINIHAAIKDVDMDRLLLSFGNFGQDAITEKNIKGKLKADVNFSALLNTDEQIAPGTMNGNIEFSLKQGQLINFEPVQNVAKKVFKNRDFSDLRFAELKDRFDINGSAIKFNRMEIESSAITLFVEGIYDTKKGTDMSIQVPLSNLKSRKEDSIPVNKGIHSSTGISARLRAKTGDDGKLKITWDPFKNALKNIKRTEAESKNKLDSLNSH